MSDRCVAAVFTVTAVVALAPAVAYLASRFIE